VGAGNVPVIIDETADLDAAAERILHKILRQTDRGEFSAHQVDDAGRGAVAERGRSDDDGIAPLDRHHRLVDPLMKACDLVVVTGSQDNVRRAYSSGTPAIGVGAGKR
jgi:sulfoacetaldehyde dehydrogenase